MTYWQWNLYLACGDCDIFWDTEYFIETGLLKNLLTLNTTWPLLCAKPNLWCFSLSQSKVVKDFSRPKRAVVRDPRLVQISMTNLFSVPADRKLEYAVNFKYILDTVCPRLELWSLCRLITNKPQVGYDTKQPKDRDITALAQRLGRHLTHGNHWVERMRSMT